MKTLIVLLLLAFMFPIFLSGDELLLNEAIPASTPVRVRFQFQTKADGQWSSSNATLTGAITESMMRNQIAEQHSYYSIRILSVEWNRIIRMRVKYQFKSVGSSWTTSYTTVSGAITQQMVENQLKSQNPKCEINVLSIKPLDLKK